MNAKYPSSGKQPLKSTQQKLNRLNRSTNRLEDKGFALPLVIVVGLFLMVGGFAMLGRTLGSFRGSIRSSQQTQAQENAERGVAVTVKMSLSVYN